MPKPRPVPATLICSECALPWDDHERAVLSECVRLLRQRLDSRAISWAANTITITPTYSTSATTWPTPNLLLFNNDPDDDDGTGSVRVPA